MHRFLEEILARRRVRIDEIRSSMTEPLDEPGAGASPPENPAASLRAGTGLIVAEVKRASPSKGPIAPEADASERARAYERGGAGAVSVLCEPDFFGGSRRDVHDASAAVSVPVLCKDFILDPIQLRMARADGARWVLLIARILGPDLRAMILEALATGLEPLVEVHSEEEMADAVSAGARLLGMNARDLDTFMVDLDLVKRLAGLCPPDRACIAESGIRGVEDLLDLRAAGAHGFLIGETLMRLRDPVPLLHQFRQALDKHSAGARP